MTVGGKMNIGRIGEVKAAAFLKKRGYVIKETNYRTPFGELDIIAEIRNYIVFIEVKTRLSSSLGPPFLSVTAIKQSRLIKNALFYLKKKDKMLSNWRIDVVSIKLGAGISADDIEHIENAVEET